MSKVTVDRRLWLNADGGLVEEGDPAAAFLWACEGREVDADDAKAVGYKPSSGPQDAEVDEPDDVDAPELDDTAEDGPDPEHVCDVCGFEAKSAGGLGAHERSHG